ncbi:hypothetical protein SISNIDRAFT_470697 [Sistotremastrum niveocremeum HHB9708]|uniref:Zn(2)-C6 fungal-type domain-containing protein n=2 Tax=Sistotremastraceae TaxID=3402574 RepID=A0A164NL38_9AGAM|nr:hypothetical protein SISNIDRAFT_470697 [Sistotremastrum niveocremeum HHB9708]KZT41947.1 hypothetical protein SISSUDRAFT_1030887 [Sistotremastrum suecicum HHB10207 ss-3]
MPKDLSKVTVKKEEAFSGVLASFTVQNAQNDAVERNGKEATRVRRRGTACDHCKKRKRKCVTLNDAQVDCRLCLHAGLECTYNNYFVIRGRRALDHARGGFVQWGVVP